MAARKERSMMDNKNSYRQEGKGWILLGAGKLVAALSCAVLLLWLVGATITTLVVVSVGACLAVAVVGVARGAYAMSLVRRAPREVAREWEMIDGVFDLIIWGACISAFPLALYFSVPASWRGMVGSAIILAAICGAVWNAWMLWGVSRVIARLKADIV